MSTSYQPPSIPTLLPCACVYYCLPEEWTGFGIVGLHQAQAISHVNKSYAHSKEKKNLADHQSLIFVSQSFIWGKKKLDLLVI